MRFNKGELTQESFDVIMHDLECLEIMLSSFNKQHLDLLKANLKDIWGLQTKNKDEKLEQQFIHYFHN